MARAAARAWPDVAVRLDSGGLGFLQPAWGRAQTGSNPVFHRRLRAEPGQRGLQRGEPVPLCRGLPVHHRSYEKALCLRRHRCPDGQANRGHYRSLLPRPSVCCFGTEYLQLPYMWRQLTFDLPDAKFQEAPDIMEVSLPRWLDDLEMPEDLKERVRESGLTQLVFKAPTRGLSLHLGFDYLGEHKMGPLSIAMFLVKQANGLALQAALSMARVKTLDGSPTNAALVTAGPSLHGKSTLTIMIELAGSDLSQAHRPDRGPERSNLPNERRYSPVAAIGPACHG